MQICTHTAVGRPNMFACWSNFCQAAEFGSVHDCTTRPPVPYGPHLPVPPSATYPCAVFSAIEQPMKPIVCVPGRGVGVGVRVGVGVGVRVGVGVGVGVLPVQVTPLRAKLAGAGLLVLFQAALKPKLVPALLARAPFQAALRAVTWAPLWVSVVFQAWVTC